MGLTRSKAILHGRSYSSENSRAAACNGKKRVEKLFEIYIQSAPERVWQALTDAEIRRKYNFGVEVASEWTQGSRYEGMGGGMVVFEGENLQVDRPRRLVQSFRALWSPDVRSERSSRVTWEIEPVRNSCLVRLTHSEISENAAPELYALWPMVLSGLKTFLETGDFLTTPASLRWLGR